MEQYGAICSSRNSPIPQLSYQLDVDIASFVCVETKMLFGGSDTCVFEELGGTKLGVVGKVLLLYFVDVGNWLLVTFLIVNRFLFIGVS